MTQVDYQVNLGLVRLPPVEKSYKKIAGGGVRQENLVGWLKFKLVGNGGC